MREPLPTNLTPLPTSFVGRGSALRSLRESLSRSRLVTVLGPPGTGKTRLVKQLALSVLSAPDAPSGGVFFCDLSETTSAFGVLVQIAQGASIPLADALPLDEAKRHLEAALRGRAPMWILLDNFEQLVRPAAHLLPDLLAAAPPETRFLVTSRERLGVPGEALFDLGPLTLPVEGAGVESEAVELFLERARAVRAPMVRDAGLVAGSGEQGFRPTDAELRDIARLVHLLDGLPLAIELAAARMRVLAPAELLERFESRFGWLTHDPSVLPRRATLRETIEASWTLLSRREQEALSQVSVFRGGFGVAAAERVLELSGVEEAPSALDVLQSLRDKSLLLAEDAGPSARRFSLLGAIRDFAEAKLDANGMQSVYERHARYHLDLGEGLCARLEMADDPETRRRLRLEHENFLAVHRRFLPVRAAAPSVAAMPADLRGASLRAALVLARSASAHPYAFSLAALDAALAVTDAAEVGENLVLRGLEARGNLRRFVGQTRESIQDFEQVLALATKAGDRALMAGALSGLGNAATVRARWAEAGSLFERAIEIVTGSQDRRAEGRLLAMLAATWYNRDDPAAARALLVRALELHRETLDRASEGISVTSLGIVALAMGSLAEARTHLGEGLFIHREVGARHWEGVTLAYLALAEQDAGRLPEAHRLYEQALSLLSEIDVRRAVGLALAGSAGALLEEGRLAEARARYRKAIDLSRTMSPDHEGLLSGCLGAIAALGDDIPSSADLFEQADRTLSPYSRPAFACAIDVYRGLLDLARARLDRDSAGAARDVRPSPARDARAPISGEALRDRARARLEAAAQWSSRSVEVRCACRLLARALAALDSEGAAAAKSALVVGPSGLWFRPPRAKTAVRLHRRRALQRIVHHLAERRLAAPGEALSIPSLVESGWPGERVLPEAGTERVYTAVATLRRLGLRKVLLQRDDGYLLDPAVDLVRSTANP